MADIAMVLDTRYHADAQCRGCNTWFGHPVRVTVVGERSVVDHGGI